MELTQCLPLVVPGTDPDQASCGRTTGIQSSEVPADRAKPSRRRSDKKAGNLCRYFVAAIIPSCCGSQIDSGGQ